MLFVPQECCTKVITNGGIVGTANPWTAVTSGTSNNYGSVVELISAANNTQDSWGIEIIIIQSGAVSVTSESVVNILAGAATEDLLIDSLICGWAYQGTAYRYFFPLYIPAGTRIAAQSASVTATNGIRIGVYLYGGGNPPFKTGGRVTTYGTKVGNARGQAITPTASGGAASVTQLAASTSRDHFYFLPGFQVEADGTIAANGWVNIGIGVGAATEERIGTWFFPKSTAEHMAGPMPFLGAFRDVPAGTRLTMLASNATANDAAHGGLIYAVG